VDAALTLEESALVNGLRDIPDGPVRDQLMALLLELVGYAGDPRCGRAQADGSPCLTVSCACEDCQQLRNVLAAMRGVRPS
jgi:hypothetical protein